MSKEIFVNNFNKYSYSGTGLKLICNDEITVYDIVLFLDENKTIRLNGKIQPANLISNKYSFINDLSNLVSKLYLECEKNNDFSINNINKYIKDAKK